MSMSFNSSGGTKILGADKISVYRDTSGILKAKVEDEEYPVRPIRCFPLTGANYYLGLFRIEPDGTIREEIALIYDVKRLDENSRKLVEEELSKAYPLLWITKIHSVKQIGRALRWHVDTDKGERIFEIRHQKDIYMIQPSLVVIKDAEGNRFQIDSEKLDPRSLSLLEIYR